MDMICHHVTFNYLALPLGGKIAKYFSQVPPEILVQNFPPAFWNKNYMVLAVPNRMI